MYAHSGTSSIKRARPKGSDKRANKCVLSMITGITKALCLCGVVAGPLFTVAWIVEGATRVNCDPLRYPISSLSLGNAGWMQIATFYYYRLAHARFRDWIATCSSAFRLGLGTRAGRNGWHRSDWRRHLCYRSTQWLPTGDSANSYRAHDSRDTPRSLWDSVFSRFAHHQLCIRAALHQKEPARLGGLLGH